VRPDSDETRRGALSTRDGDGLRNHDRAWIKSQVHANDRVVVEDVTSQFACYALWGPLAREILQSVTETDCSNDAFGYMKARDLNVGAVPCLAQRVTFVGELGLGDLLSVGVRARTLGHVDDCGKAARLTPGGYKAIESLRLREGLSRVGE